MSQPESPFCPGLPLRADQPIYGRDEVFADLHGHLARYSSINLVGERRLGKTSLLRHLLGNPRHRPPPGDPPLRLAHVDFQNNNVTDSAGFYGLALREILRGLPAHPGFTDAPARRAELDARPAADYAEFERWLRRLKDARLARPVLLVDEFERLLEPKFAEGFPAPTFFDGLNAFQTEGTLALVVASRELLMDEFDRHVRAWTSKFARYLVPVMLEELDDAAADQLLMPLFDLSGDLGTLQLARRWAGHHPCRLQCAGDALFRARVNGRDRDKAQAEYERLVGQLCRGPTAIPPIRARGGLRRGLRAVFGLPAQVGKATKQAGGMVSDLSDWLVGFVVIFGLFWVVYGLAGGQMTPADLLAKLKELWGMKP